MARQATRWLVVAVGLAALAGGGWYLLRQPAEPQGPSYGEAGIKREEIRALVSATGTLNPVNTVQVGSQVSGTIQHLFADFNDRVKQGQVIARIDPSIFQAKLAEARANLKSAEAARDKAWIEVQDAKHEYDRQAGLERKKLVAESIAESARFAYQAAQVEHQLKAASVAQAEAALQREQVNLDYTTIYAPIDGVVISRNVDVGQTVAASLQAPTLFLIAKDLARMQVEADVDEAFIGEVKQGQPVSFTVFAYPRRQFQGRVAQVRLQPKVEAGVVMYNCIIHVDNEDLALKPGMTATLSIEVARHEDALTVPNAALRYVPDWPPEKLDGIRRSLEPGQAILWRVEDGILVPQTVETGIVGDKVTEVIGSGLGEDATVAVPPRRQDAERRRRFGLSLF